MTLPHLSPPSHQWDRVGPREQSQTQHFYLGRTLYSSHPLRVLRYGDAYVVIVHPTSISLLSSSTFDVLHKQPLYGVAVDAVVANGLIWVISDADWLVALKLVHDPPGFTSAFRFIQLARHKAFETIRIPVSEIRSDPTGQRLLVTGMTDVLYLVTMSEGSLEPVIEEERELKGTLFKAVWLSQTRIAISVFDDMRKVHRLVLYDITRSPRILSSVLIPSKVTTDLKRVDDSTVLLVIEDEIVVVNLVDKAFKPVYSTKNGTFVSSVSEILDQGTLLALTNDGRLLRFDLGAEGPQNELSVGVKSGALVILGSRLVVCSETDDFRVVTTTDGVMHLQELQTPLYSNTSPVTDFKVADPYQDKTDVFFLTAGFQGSGSVREVRNGAAAQVIASAEGDFDRVTGLWACGDNIVMSFFDETRVLSLNRNTLQASSGDIVPGSRMIHAADVKGRFVRVCSQGMAIDSKSYSFPTECNKATSTPEGLIITASSSASPKRIFVYDVDHDYPLLQWVLGDLECSFLHAKTVFGKTMLFLGTYRPSVDVIEVGQAGGPRILTKRLIADDTVDRCSIPNSMALLLPFRDAGSECETGTLVIGLRDGRVLTSSVTPDFDEGAFREKRLGLSPVSLTSLPGDRAALALCDGAVHKVSQGTWGIQYHKVFLPSVRHIAPFLDGHIISLCDNALKVVRLEPPKHNIRRIDIGTTGRRLYYDRVLRSIITSCTQKVGNGNLFYSTLRLVDPVEGLVQPPLPLGSLQSSPGSRPSSTTPTKQNEVVFFIIPWRPNPKTRYIVIGTGIYSSETGQVFSGRILLLQTKKAGDRLELLWTRSMDGAVYTATTVQEVFLVVSCGTTVHVFALGTEEGGKRVRLPEGVAAGASYGHGNPELLSLAETEMRWPVTCLGANGAHLAVGCQKESVTLYSLDVAHGTDTSGAGTPCAEGLSYIASDSVTRTVNDCTLLDNLLTIATDKVGNIFGLVVGTSHLEKTLEEIFCINVGSAIVRMHLSRVECDRESGSRSASVGGDGLKPLTPSRAPLGASAAGSPVHGHASAGIVSTGERIHLATILGDIYTLFVISPSLYHPLLSLQKYLSTQPHTSPLLGNPHEDFCGVSYRYHNCIDGSYVEQALCLMDGGGGGDGNVLPKDGMMSLEFMMRWQA